MPRKSTRIHWERDDATFRVAVFDRENEGRSSFRVESGYRGARPVAKAAGDLLEAIALGSQIWEAYQSGAIETPPNAPETLDELIELVSERAKSPKTRKGYRQTWTQFARALGEARHPARIYPLDVKGYLDGYKGATRDRYLRELRAGFRWALAQGYVVEDPTAGLKQGGRSALGPWLVESDWPAYLAACSPSHQIRSGFVLETGLRLGELAAARLDWVYGKPGARFIRIAPDPRSGFVPKWGRSRAVPLTAQAERLYERALEMWGAEKGSDFIFSDAGMSPKSLGNLAASTRRAVAKSGVARVTFHGLRRSAGAMWLSHGMSLLEVSRLLGHQTIKTTEQWYAGVSDRHLADVIGRLNASRGVATRAQQEERLGRAACEGYHRHLGQRVDWQELDDHQQGAWVSSALVARAA